MRILYGRYGTALKSVRPATCNRQKMSDALTSSINSPAGRLAEVLFKKIRKGEDGHEMPTTIRDRLEKLVAATGAFGRLARVRLAAEASFLFHRAPKWTEKNVVPMFDWSSPE